MHIYFSPDYNDTTVEWDTTRKATAIAADLTTRPIAGVTLVAPRPADPTQLARAHDARYLDAVRTGTPYELAASNGLGWDPSLHRAVAASTGGVIAAATDAWRTGRHAGSLSSGLHHARRDGGLGFCTVNGLAVAAFELVDQGAQRVLILDLDAHCGGGTAGIIEGAARVEQVDLSVVSFDRYRDTANATLRLVEADDYLPTVEAELGSIVDPATIDVVLYNAGMDPHERAGGVAGITAEVLAARERLVFDWAASADVPVAWVLAGGYTGPDLSLDDLVALHRLTPEAAV